MKMSVEIETTYFVFPVKEFKNSLSMLFQFVLDHLKNNYQCEVSVNDRDWIVEKVLDTQFLVYDNDLEEMFEDEQMFIFMEANS